MRVSNRCEGFFFSVNSTVETNWLDFKDKVDCEITDDTPTPTSRSSGNNRATPSTSSPSPSTPPPPLPETNDTVGRPTVLQPTTQTDGFITPSIGSQSSGAPEWIYYVVPPLVLILVIVVVLLVYYKLRGAEFFSTRHCHIIISYVWGHRFSDDTQEIGRGVGSAWCSFPSSSRRDEKFVRRRCAHRIRVGGQRTERGEGHLDRA